jgi:carbon storage regulator CsrA
MLVLSRKPGEKICIGSDITITVVDARGNRVRIGIEAPDQVSVCRSELQESFDGFRSLDRSVDLTLDGSDVSAGV